MEKNFFEVFPVLKVSQTMQQLLADTQVQRVVSNRARTSLRVYLHGSRLIQKKYIFQLEDHIKNQLFPKQQLTVKIIERYQLSAQYTPETLMDLYKDSMLEEFRAYSLLIYNLFRCARMEFTAQNYMKLHLEDSIVAKSRADELLEILYKVVRDRCGMDLTIEPVFEPKKDHARKKESDQQIALEVSRIIGGLRDGDAGLTASETSAGGDSSGTMEVKSADATSQKKTEKKKSIKPPIRQRRKNLPDLIYPHPNRHMRQTRENRAARAESIRCADRTIRMLFTAETLKKKRRRSIRFRARWGRSQSAAKYWTWIPES